MVANENQMLATLKTSSGRVVSTLAYYVGSGKRTAAPVPFRPCLALEPGDCTLAEHIRTSSPEPLFRGRGVLKEFASAVRDLHAPERQRLHLKLKPCSVLLLWSNAAVWHCVKLTDFGLARTCQPGNELTEAREPGSAPDPQWLAPEQQVDRLGAPASAPPLVRMHLASPLRGFLVR